MDGPRHNASTTNEVAPTTGDHTRPLRNQWGFRTELRLRDGTKVLPDRDRGRVQPNMGAACAQLRYHQLILRRQRHPKSIRTDPTEDDGGGDLRRR